MIVVEKGKFMGLANDIYQVTLKAVDGAGRDIANVFFYLKQSDDVSPEIGATLLVSSFDSDVVNALRGIFHEDVTFGEIEAINLFDDTELATTTSAYTGTITGEPTPSFTCLTFSTERIRRDIRRGFKRFGPTGESAINGNELDPSVATSVGIVEGALVDALDAGATTDDFVPIIVKRIREGDASSGYTYRLPANQGEADWFEPLNWDYSHVGTQNTRKS